MRAFILILCLLNIFFTDSLTAQDLPQRYATLELSTNTPCPICGNQNPGLFNRLMAYEGQYHLISFYPGKPYSSCIFYQDNIAENAARYQFYTGKIFGTPTVALNGTEFKNSSGVTNNVLNSITGGTSWLSVDVDETSGTSRMVTIKLQDHVGGSLATGRLFAVIVEKEINYNAPNGETQHHNVFRQFLTEVSGEDVDLSSGNVEKTYTYDVDSEWDADQVYVIAWVSDKDTKEIYNSGTRFDPDVISSVDPGQQIGALRLSPNPASSFVQLDIPANILSASIDLYDQQGRLVTTIRNIEGPKQRIETVDFPPGKYVVHLKTAERMYSGTFQVIR